MSYGAGAIIVSLVVVVTAGWVWMCASIGRTPRADRTIRGWRW